MATCAPDDAASEARGPSRGADLSIPNLITLGRILLVPVVVWAITAGQVRVGILLFLAPRVSDAPVGFFCQRARLGTPLPGCLPPPPPPAKLVSFPVPALATA